jgi:hypothetical protein
VKMLVFENFVTRDWVCLLDDRVKSKKHAGVDQ